LGTGTGPAARRTAPGFPDAAGIPAVGIRGFSFAGFAADPADPAWNRPGNRAKISTTPRWTGSGAPESAGSTRSFRRSPFAFGWAEPPANPERSRADVALSLLLRAKAGSRPLPERAGRTPRRWYHCESQIGIATVRAVVGELAASLCARLWCFVAVFPRA
jgi:hypothetical protein